MSLHVMLLQFIQLYTQIIARREEDTFNKFVNDFRSNNKVSQNNFHLTEMICFFARTFLHLIYFTFYFKLFYENYWNFVCYVHAFI